MGNNYIYIFMGCFVMIVSVVYFKIIISKVLLIHGSLEIHVDAGYEFFAVVFLLLF